MTSKKQVVFVQSPSRVWLYVTPWTAAHQASWSLTNSRSLLKLKSIESVMPSNHLILCCLRLLLPYIFPSIRVFSNESVLPIRWPKYWNFGFSISPSNEYSGLIFFRIDWFDLQGTLKSLLQHHSSKASILRRSAFWKLRQLKKLTAVSKKPFVAIVLQPLPNIPKRVEEESYYMLVEVIEPGKIENKHIWFSIIDHLVFILFFLI